MKNSNHKLNNNIFGENLSKLLQQKNISQRQFAKLVDTTPATVNRWITGKRKPRFSQIIKITKALGVSTEFLIS